MTYEIWYLIHNTLTNEIMRSNKHLCTWQLTITVRLKLAILILVWNLYLINSLQK